MVTTRKPHGLLAIATALALLPMAQAQDSDPLFADAELDEQPVESEWRVYGDLNLRAEDTGGFATRDDIERQRARLRLGLRHEGETWSFAVAAKAGAGTDRNRDNRRNLDNETSNDLGLDEALLVWRPSERHALQVGKSALPLATTPLTWDNDLRPIGAVWQASIPSGDFNRWSATVGGFAGDHLYGDESRIAAAQLGWHYQEGAPFSADIHLGWLGFDDLERARAEGLMRSNRVAGGRLLSDFRLLDLQLGAQWLLDATPLNLRLDLVRNTGADEQNRGARFSSVYGRSDHPRSWELAFAWQRIGRDAVPAAFSADDWWFHSAARGIMPWVAYGIDETWSVQLSGFRERLDGQDEHIHRVLLDVRARW